MTGMLTTAEGRQMIRKSTIHITAITVAVLMACPIALAEIGKDWTQANAVAAGGDAKANPQAKAAVQKFMAGPSVFIQNAGQWEDCRPMDMAL